MFRILGLALSLMLVAGAQETAPAPQPPARRAPPKPHVNAPLGEIKSMPGDGAGAYKTRQYRDLFAEQGHSSAETQAKIGKAVRQFFHGDGQEERVYFETGANENGPLAYITDWANNDARSEGMSYGMMIAVQMDKKREFDAIWNWSKTYMLITDPHNPSVGYFAWSMNTDGTPRATGAAPDGEEFFVMALYFASHRWGNGEGIYNYQAEADKLLRGMRHHPVLTATGPFRIHPEDEPFIQPNRPWPSPNNAARLKALAASGAPAPGPRAPAPWEARSISIGPMVDEDHFMIRFVPNVDMTFTDPSYHLPAFYEVWARVGPSSEAGFWREAAETSRDFWERAANPGTGLVPDYADFDGRPKPRKTDAGGGDFRYDAWRAAMNWSVDYAWWAADKRAIARSDRLQAFFDGQGLGVYGNRFHLDGGLLGKDHSLGLVACNAVASLAASNARAWRFVDELWDARPPHGTWRYYDGMLYLMSLLELSGQLRPYFPSP